MVERCCFCIGLRTGTVIIALLIGIASTILAFSVFTAHTFGEYYLSTSVCIGLGVVYSIEALIGYSGLVGAITKSRKIIRIFALLLWVIAVLAIAMSVIELVFIYKDYGLLKTMCTDKLIEQKEKGIDYNPSKSWSQTWKRSIVVREPQFADKRNGLIERFPQENSNVNSSSNNVNSNNSQQSNSNFENSTITHASPSSTQMNNTASNNGNKTLTPADQDEIDNMCTKFIRWFTYPVVTFTHVLGILFTIYFANVVSRFSRQLKQQANYYQAKKSIIAETGDIGRSPLSRLSGDSDGSADLESEKKLPRGIHTDV
ncbi:8704_t:CDS:2 [Ambispora gerdemannii]|uniref:8704_t:CDS:1 n=1 Tax=Ambispora gerdemannii TaxID=144530 RepID=A0A9N8Z658_9GLOM|nr:8704_t:CDS:2 [Ambispora gerdemannii]